MQGTWPYALYSHSFFKLENGESATTILHSLLKRRLTDPILLPQPTTVYPSY